MAWPTPVQTSYSTSSTTASGSAFTLGSNGTVGNTVIAVVYGNSGSPTCTSGMGSVISLGSVDGGSGVVAFFYRIPVTNSGSNTITWTNSGNYWVFAQEYPGTATAVFSSTTASGSISPSVVSGNVVVVGMDMGGAPTAFTHSGTATFTDIDTGTFLSWGNWSDAAYCNVTGGTSVTFGWTNTASTWGLGAVVLSQSSTTTAAATQSAATMAGQSATVSALTTNVAGTVGAEACAGQTGNAVVTANAQIP